MEHLGGIDDDTWTFRLKALTNGMQGRFIVSMYNEDDILLERAFGLYKPNNNWSQIATQFPDWNADRTEDPELAPAMSMEVMNGNVLKVRYRIPTDSAYLQIVDPEESKQWDSISVGTSDVFNHPGGTTTGFAQLALPIGLNHPALKCRGWPVWAKACGSHSSIRALSFGESL
jgi:hypothetical protein